MERIARVVLNFSQQTKLSATLHFLIKRSRMILYITFQILQKIQFFDLNFFFKFEKKVFNVFLNMPLSCNNYKVQQMAKNSLVKSTTYKSEICFSEKLLMPIFVEFERIFDH